MLEYGMGTNSRRDPTFLQLAAVAAIGGAGAIGTAIFCAGVAWRSGHFASSFYFFGLWGLAALVGAAANVVVYLKSGDPPEKPPRGGQKVVALRSLRTTTPSIRSEQDREAA